jgi:hypothetical protein
VGRHRFTIQQWEGIVRASIRVKRPDDVGQIAAIALREECPAWHAASIFYKTLDSCMCAPCVRARSRVLARKRSNGGGSSNNA